MEGARVRPRADKKIGKVGEKPTFALEVKNQGMAQWGVLTIRMHLSCRSESLVQAEFLKILS